MRISVEATGYQAYLDVSVVCPPGGKFGHYRQIPSLKEYLEFWQDEPRVEQHTAEGNWLLRELAGLDAVLYLSSLDAILLLGEVYDKVDFKG